MHKTYVSIKISYIFNEQFALKRLSLAFLIDFGTILPVAKAWQAKGNKLLLKFESKELNFVV